MSKAPKNLDKKRAEEKLLVSEMIALYCRKQHGTTKGSLTAFSNEKRQEHRLFPPAVPCRHFAFCTGSAAPEKVRAF